MCKALRLPTCERTFCLLANGVSGPPLLIALSRQYFIGLSTLYHTYSIFVKYDNGPKYFFNYKKLEINGFCDILKSIINLISMNKYISYLAGFLFVAGVVWLIVTPGKPSKYDDFAKCIKNSGTEFYGAFWCQHCQNQKSMFGKSAQYLPYIECSTPDGKGQVPNCTEKGIMSYPTWFFPVSGTSTPERLNGEVSLEDLAKKTSCVLPQ